MVKFQELLNGKNINFLIGSGASVPLYPTLSLGKEFPSFEQIVTHEELEETVKELLYVYYYVKWISPMRLNNIKSISKEDDVLKNYNFFIKTIVELLRRESNEKPKRANIFTTNYDLLFETAFDKEASENPICYFNDGSRGFINRYINNNNFFLNVSHSGYNDRYQREIPTINLFKLHGSISWVKKENEIQLDYTEHILEKIDEQVEKIFYSLSNGNFDEVLKEYEGTYHLADVIQYLNNKIGGWFINSDELDEFTRLYTEVPIINPNKYKFENTVLEQHYYQQLRSFSYELEKKDTVLIVFGFSFADEHILDIFKRSLLNPKLQIFIISFSKDNQNSMKREFNGYNNIYYYPEKFTNGDGTNLHGNFSYLISLIKGDIDE